MSEAASRLDSLAYQLLQTRDHKGALEAQLETCKQQIKEKESALVELMDSLGLSNFTMGENGAGSGGKVSYQFIKSVSSYPRVISDDFLPWLDANGEGGIIKRTVHPQTLRAWWKENGERVIGEVKGMVEVYEEVRVNVRRKG